MKKGTTSQDASKRNAVIAQIINRRKQHNISAVKHDRDSLKEKSIEGLNRINAAEQHAAEIIKLNVTPLEHDEYNSLNLFLQGEKRRRNILLSMNIRLEHLTKMKKLAPGAKVILLRNYTDWKAGDIFTLVKTRRTKMSIKDKKGGQWSVPIKDFGDANNEKDVASATASKTLGALFR